MKMMALVVNGRFWNQVPDLASGRTSSQDSDSQWLPRSAARAPKLLR